MLASSHRPAKHYGGDPMKTTQALRRLLNEDGFIYMPVAYDALGGGLVPDAGFPAVYNGGFVTGGTRCTSEPLLTMDEQVRVAGDAHLLVHGQQRLRRAARAAGHEPAVVDSGKAGVGHQPA